MALVKNAWYVAAWPDQVTSKEIFSRTICGEAMVFFRDVTGQPVALEDTCPHRMMPLSQGWLEEDCTVRCGYHGMRFDGSGHCVEVPGQAKIPERATVHAFPVVERHGSIWVWPGDASAADPATVPGIFAPNDHPDWTVVRGVTHVAGNYQLLNDNLLDLTHETYVHRDSLGHESISQAPIEIEQEGDDITVTRWIPDHIPAPFWKAALGKGDVRCDRWQIIHFTPPATLLLEVGVAPVEAKARDGNRGAGAEGFNSHALTPETEDSTWYFYTFGRKFLRDDKTLDERLQTSVAGIIDQDKATIEAVAANMSRHPNREFINLKADGGALRARRVVAKMERLEQLRQEPQLVG